MPANLSGRVSTSVGVALPIALNRMRNETGRFPIRMLERALRALIAPQRFEHDRSVAIRRIRAQRLRVSARCAPGAIFARGLIVGSAVMLGSYASKPFVLRMAPEQFRLVMDALMLVAGVTMIATALA
jgi:hypothetical protein